MTDFKHIKVGDVITRMLAGKVPMQLKVSEVTEDKIIAGWYTFDRIYGAEIDEDLNWGPPPLATGSFILREPENAKEGSATPVH